MTCWKNANRTSQQSVTLDLHEIQATVLRYRPEPYFGTHVLMRMDDARSGREFLRQTRAACGFRSRLVERSRSLDCSCDQLYRP